MKFRLVAVLCVMGALTACMENGPASDPLGLGHYDRDAVCTNLNNQLAFMQDQGYEVTNQGNTQSKMQQLTASYKANGCDK